MNHIDFPADAAALSILQGRDASVMAGIRNPGIAATLWQRKQSLGFANWVNTLSPDQLPRLRTIVGVDALEGCIQAACNIANTPVGPQRDLLASDIAALGTVMAQVMDSPLLHVRLDVVTNNACRRFHVDNMQARMLCTYRGQGTEVAQPGEEETPLKVPEGSVILLRGKLWPSSEETRLLHRSPPIEGTGEARLLLVIDAAGDHSSSRALH